MNVSLDLPCVQKLLLLHCLSMEDLSVSAIPSLKALVRTITAMTGETPFFFRLVSSFNILKTDTFSACWVILLFQ